MILRRALLVCFITAGAFLTQAAVAVPPPAGSSSGYNLYTSFPGGAGIPSGAVNVVPGNDEPEPLKTEAEKNDAKVTDNFLGCGGVGELEFTSGVFNAPESYGKFQQDADSLLAKQLLALNFVMPQTAALFDQLNSYGSQRFQTFQKGCNLTALQEDAKKRYLKACVEKVAKDREDVIKKATQGTDLLKKDSNDALLKAMSQAQAYDICTNQYVSNTQILKQRKESLSTFADQIRAVENVNVAIAPLLCGEAESKGCWQTLLIPQARVCIESSLGCTSSGGSGKADEGYQITNPVLSMPRLFDAFRLAMDEIVINRKLNSYYNQLGKDGIGVSAQQSSAREAAIAMSNVTLARAKEEPSADNSQVSLGNAPSSSPDDSVKSFQLSYLNCPSSDVMKPLELLSKKINDRRSSGGGNNGQTDITAPKLETSDFSSIVTGMKVTGEGNDNLDELMLSALGCAAVQTIPLFDPNVIVSVNQCPDVGDRAAFYSMAGYDVSLEATRNVYRYLSTSLKQVYARLLTDATVPGQKTNGNDEPIQSPELNARLAAVVKDGMIPYVESQLQRLDDLTKSRGAFAQRVQQIYANRGGCISGVSGVGSAPSGGRR